MKTKILKLFRSPVHKKMGRLQYYLHNIARDSLPQFIFRQRLDHILSKVSRYNPEGITARLQYYNKLSGLFDLDSADATVATIPLNSSMYYYDLKEHARYFPRHFQLSFVFGDVTHVPGKPSFVKSRPIMGDNRNSVLMHLNKPRHFYIPADPVSFDQKMPLAVWRGSLTNPRRAALVERYATHPSCNVGIVSANPAMQGRKPFMSVAEHMRYRYILSIEGNDVATNLKWILASNSLCMQPRPVYETWLMEGRLEAGRHYVELRDDFTDLEEKIDYYNRHPEETREIIGNAQAFIRQFFDREFEQLISLLVMHKYFVASGQMEPHPQVRHLLGA